MTTDSKYIVFKRSDWTHYLGEPPEQLALEDAVVIRCGDVFASPLLHAYASMVGVAASLSPVEERKPLLVIADYFNARAAEADECNPKVPD